MILYSRIVNWAWRQELVPMFLGYLHFCFWAFKVIKTTKKLKKQLDGIFSVQHKCRTSQRETPVDLGRLISCEICSDCYHILYFLIYSICSALFLPPDIQRLLSKHVIQALAALWFVACLCSLWPICHLSLDWQRQSSIKAVEQSRSFVAHSSNCPDLHPDWKLDSNWTVQIVVVVAVGCLNSWEDPSLYPGRLWR